MGHFLRLAVLIFLFTGLFAQAMAGNIGTSLIYSVILFITIHSAYPNIPTEDDAE